MKTNDIRFALLASLCLAPAAPAQNGADAQKNLAQQANNPIADMISLPFQYNGNFNIGPHNRTQSVLTIQPVIPFTLSEDWLLVTRWVLPIVDQPDLASNSGSTFGLGDLNPAFFFSPSPKLTGLPEELTIGFGPGFQVPTHTDPKLGINKWGAGPTVLAVYAKDKWLFGALAANTWSLGDDGESLNSMLVEPFVTYNITEEWYFISDLVITADWNAPSSDRWIVPIGAGLGRTFTIGKQAMNANLQGYWNVVSPDEGPDWSVVATLQFLFPK